MKVAKLSKLKSAVMKKLPSFNKLDRTMSSSNDAQCAAAEVTGGDDHLRAVYVGKSRRRYMVRSEVVAHPLFQVLVNKSESEDGTINVACEVVMFEHLLWMLENADSQLDDGDLVEFYTAQ